MRWGVRRYQPYGEGGYTPKKKRSGAERLKRASRVAGAVAGAAGIAGAGYATAKGVQSHRKKMKSMSDDERAAYRARFYGRENEGGGGDKKKKKSKSPAETMTNDAAQIGRELQNVNRSVGRLNRKPGKSAEGMSDAELRAAINRLEMERRYEALTSDEVNRGSDTVNDILSIGVSTLTIASLGLGMYATYKGLDKK